MRGRCLGAIVDQLVLGRFLADLVRFLINFGIIGPKRKYEEIMRKSMILEPRGPKINQNGAQEHSENELGGKSVSRITPRPHPEMILRAILARLARFWAPFGAQLGAKGVPKSSFLTPGRAKTTKNCVQNEAS